MSSKVRLAALFGAFVLLTASCGARLNSQQREAAIRAAAGGGVSSSSTGGVSSPTGGGSSAAGPTGSVGGGGGGTTAAGPGGGTSFSGGGGGGGGGGAPGPGGGGGGGRASSTCTGGTDKGLTSNEIRLATIYDGTGVQGGLFNSAFQATEAAAAYFNSIGGICGRHVQIDAYDDHTESTGNRAATQNACGKDFAIVGSMSAFDDGGVPVIKNCGIPDVPAVPVTPQHETANTTHASYPNRGDYFIEAYPRYIAKHYGDSVIKNAGIIWLNASAPRSNAQARMSAYEKAGFKWVYHQEVQAVEPNYAPYIAAMQSAGVQYFTMVGNWQSIGRLLDAAQQQGWKPKVYDWDSVVYDPGFIAQYGQQAEGSLFYMNVTPVEEARSNKEVALYLYWLNKTCGNCTPTYFGEYAWSAARLFQAAAEKVNGNLSREAFLKQIENIHEWNDYGLSATHDPGRNIPSPCIFYGKIQRGKFVRVDPSGSGFDCSLGGLLRQ